MVLSFIHSVSFILVWVAVDQEPILGTHPGGDTSACAMYVHSITPRGSLAWTILFVHLFRFWTFLGDRRKPENPEESRVKGGGPRMWRKVVDV